MKYVKLPNIKFYFLYLAAICIIAFIFQNLPFLPNFTNLFVLNQDAVESMEIWRFVTAIFLHGGLGHLAYNMFALLFFGIILEKLVGSKKFLIIFFTSGIIANIISVNFYNSSLGASGAIYGIIGAVAIIKPMMMVWAFGIIMPMFIAAILWTIGDILGALGMFDGNTGHIAHLSGIGVGIIVAAILKIPIKFFSENNQNKSNANLNIKISDSEVRNWENNYMR